MKPAQLKSILLLFMIISTALPANALVIPIGSLEIKYVILSGEPSTTKMNPLSSYMYTSTTESEEKIMLSSLAVEYSLYAGKRKLVWAAPKNSSRFVPNYNESIYLPEELKEITKEIAESSETIAEFAWKVSWFVNQNIKYEDVSFNVEKDRTFFREEDINMLIDEIWKKKKGVCRHKAILMERMLRYAGVEAKYAGGYAIIPIKGKHPYIPPQDIDTIEELMEFSTHTGFGHAWVIVHDPAVGWYPLDPTRQKDPLHPILKDNLAVYIGNYTSYAPDGIPLFRIENVQNYTTEVNEVNYKNMKIVESSDTGIVVYNPEKNQIDYYPGGYSLIIPQTFNWSYGSYFENKTVNTNITVIHWRGKYYVKISGIKLPLYFTNNGKPITPLYKKGDYYVYREKDLNVRNGTAYFETPYYTLKVEVKEEPFGEVLVFGHFNFHAQFHRALIPY